LIKKKSNQHFFKIGFVGTLSPWQDFDTLINCVKILKDKFKLESFKLYIIGEGIEKIKILNLIESLNISTNVELVGLVEHSEISNRISDFDICVAPLKGSRNMNTGSSALKVFEYLAMNKYIVISECGNLSDLIEMHKFGCSYVSGNSFAMANCIYNYFKKPTIINSRDFVSENYNWNSKANFLIKELSS
jgi:glycosyltransferase involved in cell wall biosynthesis